MNMITVITVKNIGTKTVISMIWSCFGLNDQWQERLIQRIFHSNLNGKLP